MQARVASQRFDYRRPSAGILTKIGENHKPCGQYFGVFFLPIFAHFRSTFDPFPRSISGSFSGSFSGPFQVFQILFWSISGPFPVLFRSISDSFLVHFCFIYQKLFYGPS